MIHTLYDYKNEREGFNLCTRHIKYLVNNVGDSYLKIGVLLNLLQSYHRRYIEDKYNYGWKIQHIEFSLFDVNRGRRRDSFRDIYDYAAYEFGFSRGSVNNFMNIARRFSENSISFVDGSVKLLPEYMGYSVSQLIQLLPYTDEQIKAFISAGKINPNMSCRFLRATLKQLTTSPALEDVSKNDDVIDGQLLTSDDDTEISNEENELYAACNEFEKECSTELAEPKESQLVFSFEPDDLEMNAIFQLNDDKSNIVGFHNLYGSIFFDKLYELFKQGYRIEINAVEKKF